MTPLNVFMILQVGSSPSLLVVADNVLEMRIRCKGTLFLLSNNFVGRKNMNTCMTNAKYSVAHTTLFFYKKRFKISVIIHRKKPTVLKYSDDAIIFLFFSISSVKSARKQDGKIVVFSVRNRNRCTESLSYFRFRTLNFSVPVLILHHDYQLLYS